MQTNISNSKTTTTDDAILLRNLIEQYGNAGAEYLDTLDYSKATEQEPRTVMFGRAKVTEKRYTIGTPDEFGELQIYGLYRRYDINGNRSLYVVYKDGICIEIRWYYNKTESTYKSSVRIDADTLYYQVEDGKVTRANLSRGNNLLTVVFDDTNRPETPRDLPAPTCQSETNN